jgi:hypothetical protein
VTTSKLPVVVYLPWYDVIVPLSQPYDAEMVVCQLSLFDVESAKTREANAINLTEKSFLDNFLRFVGTPTFVRNNFCSNCIAD